MTKGKSDPIEDANLESARRDRRAIERAVEELNRTMDEALVKLEEFSGAGYPSGTGESSIGGGRVSDPTGATVVALDQSGGDTFRSKRNKIIGCVREARELLVVAAKEARTAANAVSTKGKGTETCVPCSQAAFPPDAHNCGVQCDGKGAHQHPLRFQPLYTRRRLTPEALPVALCRWHHDFIGRYGVMPAAELVLFHLDHLGGKVPYTLIREHHREAFDTAQASARRAS